MQRAFKAAHGFEKVRLFLGRVAADMEQRKDQRGELVAQRETGEVDARGLSRLADGKTGATGIAAVEARADLVGQGGDFLNQAARVDALRVVTEAGDEFDRVAQVAEISLELGSGGGIEQRHGEGS